MRQWIYGAGCPRGNEEIYVRRFETHNREVGEHFSNRTDDLLVMNLADGDGWDQLCPFLGKEVPPVPFPHANRAATGAGVASSARNLLHRIAARTRGRAR